MCLLVCGCWCDKWLSFSRLFLSAWKLVRFDPTIWQIRIEIHSHEEAEEIARQKDYRFKHRSLSPNTSNEQFYKTLKRVENGIPFISVTFHYSSECVACCVTVWLKNLIPQMKRKKEKQTIWYFLRRLFAYVDTQQIINSCLRFDLIVCVCDTYHIFYLMIRTARGLLSVYCTTYTSCRFVHWNHR